MRQNEDELFVVNEFFKLLTVPKTNAEGNSSNEYVHNKSLQYFSEGLSLQSYVNNTNTAGKYKSAADKFLAK